MSLSASLTMYSELSDFFKFCVCLVAGTWKRETFLSRFFPPFIVLQGDYFMKEINGIVFSEGKGTYSC